MSLTSVNVRRNALLGVALTSTLTFIVFNCPPIATGAPISVGILMHYVDSNNYYSGELVFNTNSTISIEITRVLNGSSSVIATKVTSIPYIPGKVMRLSSLIDNGVISCKGWILPPDGFEPSTYQVSVTDTNISKGISGVTSVLRTGNTNTTPVPITFPFLSMPFFVFVYNDTTGLGSTSILNGVMLSRQNSSGDPDGSLPAFEFNDVPIDSSGPQTSLILRDRWSSVILSDSYQGAGMSDPQFHVQFFDSALTKTTTSATFVNFMSSFWYVYHPHLRVRVLVNTPATTTYEIRITEANSGSNTQLAIVTTTASTFAYWDLIVSRVDIPASVGVGPGFNGNSVNLNLEWRRATGAGTATMAFVEAIATDFTFIPA
jgi:hypothetical protein